MASFVPQLVKMVREKQAEGVSLRTYLVMVAGFILWVAYGVLLKSWPIAASNTINLILAATILALKFHIERRDGKS
jgi:MtN3 and saliva related transmembrane protein